MYFDKCQTLEQLKAEYRRLVMLHHPDMGGDVRIMQDINAEHDRVFDRLKAKQNAEAAAPESKTRATTETAEEFRAIIYALIKLEGLEIELCGRWLWIGGDTKTHKDRLKELGCKWAPKKKLWSWHHAEDSDPRFRGKKSMGDIRAKYGSSVYYARVNSDLATA